MAKARSRTTARKVKDKWKAKSWYSILAPTSFDSVTIADTLTDNPDDLVNRITEVSLQDLTNDFRKSHIKLFFQIHNLEGNNAHTQYIGHTLTSDYLRRMIRRKKSKIDGVYDVSTRDGAMVRVKPFATTDKRIQNSQKRLVRETMKNTIYEKAQTNTLSEFVKTILDGKISVDIYKNCKKLYPVKRVEIFKTEVVSQPTVEHEEETETKIIDKPDISEGKEDSEEKQKEKPIETPSLPKKIENSESETLEETTKITAEEQKQPVTSLEKGKKTRKKQTKKGKKSNAAKSIEKDESKTPDIPEKKTSNKKKKK